MKKNNVEYHAGGSTQNSVKIAQVSLRLPCRATPLGLPVTLDLSGLAALGIESIAAQHVDTLQLKVLGIHQTCHGKREVGKIHNICKRYLVALIFLRHIKHQLGRITIRCN